jgi:tetratricopeptide (TPR) repeat protein
VQAFRHQDYAAAVHHLDQIPADEPASLPALDLRAAALLQQERLEEAETVCQTVLTFDPWHADAHFLLGLVFRQQGQAEAAIEALKQVIYLQPSHRDAHFFLAETYRALGLVDQARREYENTLNILTYSLQETPTPPSLREVAGINLTGLTDNILRRACEANLRKLQGRSQTAPRSQPGDQVSVER